MSIAFARVKDLRNVAELMEEANEQEMKREVRRKGKNASAPRHP
jgi:hypothetical protein